MPHDASVRIHLVFAHEQVKPSENFVVPLQTGEGVKSHLCVLRTKRTAKPIPVVQNPVVLIGEDNQSSWYTLPAIDLVTRLSGAKGSDSLLQRMECANPIRLG